MAIILPGLIMSGIAVGLVQPNLFLDPTLASYKK